MGFLGCALLPVLQGRLADNIGLQHSFAICVVPYLFVLFYALHCTRVELVSRPGPASIAKSSIPALGGQTSHSTKP
jgi:FHS family L-fucose permease-like MFS transporter